jgi:hypothetical protein
MHKTRRAYFKGKGIDISQFKGALSVIVLGIDSHKPKRRWRARWRCGVTPRACAWW